MIFTYPEQTDSREEIAMPSTKMRSQNRFRTDTMPNRTLARLHLDLSTTTDSDRMTARTWKLCIVKPVNKIDNAHKNTDSTVHFPLNASIQYAAIDDKSTSRSFQAAFSMNHINNRIACFRNYRLQTIDALNSLKKTQDR